MSQVAYVLVGLFVVGIIVTSFFVVWYFSKDAVTKRALRKAPRMQIRDVPDGATVKISGALALGPVAMHAPLSGRPCAYYDVTVEQYRSSGKSGSWHTIIRESEARDFFIEDQTGKALVRMVTAEVAVTKDAHFRSGTFNDATEQLESFLARHGRSSTGPLGFNKSLRYREGVLEASEHVAVYGSAHWEIDPEPGATASYRDAARRLVLDAPHGGNLLASDDASTLA